MISENELIVRFLEIFDDPTLKAISKMTGLNQTRVFRIINGAPMKLSEYFIFKKKINEKLGVLHYWVAMEECLLKLPGKELRELEREFIRKLKINQLINLSPLN